MQGAMERQGLLVRTAQSWNPQSLWTACTLGAQPTKGVTPRRPVTVWDTDQTLWLHDDKGIEVLFLSKSVHFLGYLKSNCVKPLQSLCVMRINDHIALERDTVNQTAHKHWEKVC